MPTDDEIIQALKKLIDGGAIEFIQHDDGSVEVKVN